MQSKVEVLGHKVSVKGLSLLNYEINKQLIAPIDLNYDFSLEQLDIIGTLLINMTRSYLYS